MEREIVDYNKHLPSGRLGFDSQLHWGYYSFTRFTEQVKWQGNISEIFVSSAGCPGLGLCYWGFLRIDSKDRILLWNNSPPIPPCPESLHCNQYSHHIQS